MPNQDIKVRAYMLAIHSIAFIDKLEQKDFTVQIISKQSLRSITSIGANIIEAQAGSSRRDFVNYLSHALKSANESKFWLGLLRDSKKCNAEQANLLLKEVIEIANILGASISTIKGKRKL